MNVLIFLSHVIAFSAHVILVGQTGVCVMYDPSLEVDDLFRIHIQ